MNNFRLLSGKSIKLIRNGHYTILFMKQPKGTLTVTFHYFNPSDLTIHREDIELRISLPFDEYCAFGKFLLDYYIGLKYEPADLMKELLSNISVLSKERLGLNQINNG